MSSSGSYHRINKQMKFQFLNRVLAQGESIYDVAKEIGIHYSTAKTIVFFHKHAHKSYRSFKVQSIAPQLYTQQAQYQEIGPDKQRSQNITIVTNRNFFGWQPRKEVKAGNIQLTYLRNSKPQRVKIYPISKGSSIFTSKAKSNGCSKPKRKGREGGVQSSAELSDSQYVCTQ